MIGRSAIWCALARNVLSIQGTACMWEVPSAEKLISDFLPLRWGSGAGDYLCSVLINYGLADFRDKHWHGVTGNPEVTLYAAVTVAGCQMTHGTGKLQSWIKGFPPPGIFFGDEGRDPSQDFIVQFHGQPHVVDESFWIFFSQLPHQCVILAELPPSGYPGLDPVSFISTGSQCPSVQIIIGKQKVIFFFFFHESNLLQKSQPTSSIHGGPVKVLSLTDWHTHSLPFILQTWEAQPNLEIHASWILQLSAYSG